MEKQGFIVRENDPNSTPAKPKLLGASKFPTLTLRGGGIPLSSTASIQSSPRERLNLSPRAINFSPRDQEQSDPQQATSLQTNDSQPINNNGKTNNNNNNNQNDNENQNDNVSKSKPSRDKQQRTIVSPRESNPKTQVEISVVSPSNESSVLSPRAGKTNEVQSSVATDVPNSNKQSSKSLVSKSQSENNQIDQLNSRSKKKLNLPLSDALGPKGKVSNDY